MRSWDELTLQARRTIYANNLPSNREYANDLNDATESTGWTVQQPFAHIRTTGNLRCVLCAHPLPKESWTRHDCVVRKAMAVGETDRP